MFNVTLKRDAMTIHQTVSKRYNKSHEDMVAKSHELYITRTRAIVLLGELEQFVNTIAHTPKEIETKMGLIKDEMKSFRETESYAKETLNNEIKAGVGMAAAVAGGLGFAGLAPAVAMHIATTFGKASTGAAIKTLSGAAAQKAALAWLGGGALSTGGAGIAGGQALLALAGPIGWGIAAGQMGISLFFLSRKNRKISDKIIEESKIIMEAKEGMDETTASIINLNNKTQALAEEIAIKIKEGKRFRHADYQTLEKDEVLFLGALVNNAFSLAVLVNKIIE